jgi:hypothetical protein
MGKTRTQMRRETADVWVWCRVLQKSRVFAGALA